MAKQPKKVNYMQLIVESRTEFKSEDAARAAAEQVDRHVKTAFDLLHTEIHIFEAPAGGI